MRSWLMSTTVMRHSGQWSAMTAIVGPPTYPAPMQRIFLGVVMVLLVDSWVVVGENARIATRGGRACQAASPSPRSPFCASLPPAGGYGVGVVSFGQRRICFSNEPSGMRRHSASVIPCGVTTSPRKCSRSSWKSGRNLKVL